MTILTRTSTLLLLLFLPLVACAGFSGTATLTPSPEFTTVTPPPTVEGFPSSAAFPAGQFLFIAVSGGQECGVFCNCPAIEAVQDPFTFQDGKLVLNWRASNAATTQSWSDLRSELGALGLYAYYDRTSGGLITFDALPFSPKRQDFSIEAVDASGKIAVRTPDGLAAIEPGKRIQQQSVSLWNGLCRIRKTTTLTNHGFLSDSQVVLR